MKKTDWAYLAGFFDGEGCISLYKNDGRHYRLEICMANTNEWVAKWFHFVFGGTLYLEEASKKNPKWRDVWRWQLRSRKTQYFLISLLPYLKLKKPQAELALQFLERKIQGKHTIPEQSILEEADGILLSYYNTGRRK